MTQEVYGLGNRDESVAAGGGNSSKGSTVPGVTRREQVSLGDTCCWLWKASRDRDGYGKIKYGGTMRLAHRVIYELLVGAIPEGLQIDHLCRQRGCVNPAHLRPVTWRENQLAPGSRARAAACAAKTQCPRGHPYDSENTYVWRGERYCRACRRPRDRERQRRKSGNGRSL